MIVIFFYSEILINMCARIRLLFRHPLLLVTNKCGEVPFLSSLEACTFFGLKEHHHRNKHIEANRQTNRQTQTHTQTFTQTQTHTHSGIQNKEVYDPVDIC